MLILWHPLVTSGHGSAPWKVSISWPWSSLCCGCAGRCGSDGSCHSGYTWKWRLQVELVYHWRELPQVSFLLSQKFCFVMTKYVLCHDKSMLAATKLCLSQQNTFVMTKVLLRQAYFCCNKRRVFPWQKTCLSQHIFVVMKVLSQQTYFCRDMHTFVMTKDVFCSDKHVFDATNMCLSWQIFCCDRNDTCGSSCQWYLLAVLASHS